MDNTEYLLGYINKLSHPLKEIRERALRLLINKLRLGWELDDELSGIRRILEALLAWFQSSTPTLQREALELLLTSIKTKSGPYIARELGVKQIISNLNSIRHKIAQDAEDLFVDVVETLRFLNTLESEENVTVPQLCIPDITSSESENGSCYYNLDPNAPTSKETSISNGDYDHGKSPRCSDGIRVLLFPWVELCQSDCKTMLLIEDALRLLKSTRRCCRFICDVFLRDFPAEIFLNRPGIIKNLISISESNNRPSEALRVLLCITQALRNRLLQLSSLDLIHEMHKFSDDYKELEEGVNIELEQIVEGLEESPREDGLAALRQMPAPIYALDTVNAVLSIMARSIVLIDPVTNIETFDLKELNLCLCLIESLIGLLLDCVTDKFWCSDHNYKTHRDIGHKSCMVMRALGNLLMKYRSSFYEDSRRSHHRVWWLRLLSCAERVLYWARDSALPPSAIVVALQSAQIDPVLDLFYPDLSFKINVALQSTKTSIDQEYKAKYKQLKKLCASMEEAVIFMKNKNRCRNTKNVYTCIKNSLLVLEIFQSEPFLNDIADFLLVKTKNFELNDSDWSLVRSIALSLMASNIEWVSAKFYILLADMVKSMLMSDEMYQKENEKCLTLMCDVSILTEICCHGLSSKCKEVEESSSAIMLYLLRGRLVLSDGCWWRLLASLLPVFPLLHVYAAHDTDLGQAICKSLERDIAECMGVSRAEIMYGLVRLVFVSCVAVQLDATHSLCRYLDDEKYLPPRESLRADILLNALKRVEPQDFNVDMSSSPSKTPMTAGLTQILDVLKQDIYLDEHGTEFVVSSIQPTLEPSLRRNTLQQLAVMMRQQGLHETFLSYDGLKIIVAILRMSLMVDDYLAYPECAISCVSVINSVCFVSRHNLAKIPDLPALLIRVILVFPSNDSAVLMSAQVLAILVWAGFTLQELDTDRRRVPALPLCVTQRTTLPFRANSYWSTSPNAEHSCVEWLLADEDWRTAIRVHWWCTNVGRDKVLLDQPPAGAPPSLRVCARDGALLRGAAPLHALCTSLLALHNAATHAHVIDALCVLHSYSYLVPLSSLTSDQLSTLPWHHTNRYLSAAPASSRDATLLVTMLQFIIAYMDNITMDGDTMSWIKCAFIGAETNVISLLSRTQFYPQQTQQDNIEIIQVHIHILKVLIRCIILLEKYNDYSTDKMESLIKILLTCLDKVDLKNFHLLGYLNELMRCVRYAVNSRYCRLSEDTLIDSLSITSRTLTGCASGCGRKGQACRLDAMLSVLALLRHVHDESIPIQRWSETFNNEVISAVLKCATAARVELRAASLHVISALAYYGQMLPHLLQGIEDQSLSQYAVRIFTQRSEANVVRSAAASLLASVASRASPKSDILESEMLEQLEDNNFIDCVLDILVNFCNSTEYERSFDIDIAILRNKVLCYACLSKGIKTSRHILTWLLPVDRVMNEEGFDVYIREPNISLSVLERRSELEVRAQKCSDVRVSPIPAKYRGIPPPTASLVVSLADVLNNVNVFGKCPVQQWNTQGLYRVLFKCASWSRGIEADDECVRAAVCRSLVTVASHKCVRTTLAATKDCLHNLLTTLTPLHKDTVDPISLTARAQALLLISSLLDESSAVETVWSFLKEDTTNSMLYLILQCLESDEQELQDASIYCLTKLAQSATKKHHPDKTKDESYMELYDGIKSPYNLRYDSGDGRKNDQCQPEFMSEEICKALLNLFYKVSSENKDYISALEKRWSRIVSCLCSVLCGSARSREYCLHVNAHARLAAALQRLRDILTVRERPKDVLKSADSNPILNALYWLLTLIDCCMIDCAAAKEAFVEENVAVSLNRLWSWCMLTDQLRCAVMQLLYNFTNGCPKAWGAMCLCVSGRSLLGEVCALCVRSAALRAHTHPPALLTRALHTLTHCVQHHHCRAILLKSEVLSSMYKLVCRERARWAGGACGASGAGGAWARLCAAVCAGGAGGAEGVLQAIRAVRGALHVLPPAVRAALLPALAHAATHQRHMFLQSPELLELLEGTLLAGDIAEIVSAARAVWALAANNHKAKLQLRSAGLAAAVQSALQRVQQSHKDATTERALQLLTYTNTVLQRT